MIKIKPPQLHIGAASDGGTCVPIDVLVEKVEQTAVLGLIMTKERTITEPQASSNTAKTLVAVLRGLEIDTAAEVMVRALKGGFVSEDVIVEALRILKEEGDILWEVPPGPKHGTLH